MDELKPLTDAELTACVHLAEELSSNLLQQGNVANAQSIVADMQRLVGQVRRLRAGKWLDQAILEIAEIRNAATSHRPARGR